MTEIEKSIALIRTELNLVSDPTQKQELNQKLNILLLRKEIEQIQKRIQQLSGN